MPSLEGGRGERKTNHPGWSGVCAGDESVLSGKKKVIAGHQKVIETAGEKEN